MDGGTAPQRKPALKENFNWDALSENQQLQRCTCSNEARFCVLQRQLHLYLVPLNVFLDRNTYNQQ